MGGVVLEAGKHLLTQKPLAVSVRAGQRLVTLAAERGLTLGVFENVRQAPAVRAAAWAVRAGVIGQAQAAVIGSLGGFWSPDRVVAQTPWRHRKLLGGGVEVEDRAYERGLDDVTRALRQSARYLRQFVS